MKTLMRAFLILALSSVPQLAVAVDPPGWIGPFEIDTIVVQPNNRLYVQVVGATPDLGCPGNDSGWMELDTAAPFFKEQYALLLAAHTVGAAVKFYVSGCGHFPYAQNSHYE